MNIDDGDDPKVRRKRLKMEMSVNPEFRSWRRFHGDLVIDFGLRLRFVDSTSAKLGDRKLRRFPAVGCVAAGRPTKWTNAGPSGGPLGPVEHRRGKPGRAVWRAGDNWGSGRRAEILRAD